MDENNIKKVESEKSFGKINSALANPVVAEYLKDNNPVQLRSSRARMNDLNSGTSSNYKRRLSDVSGAEIKENSSKS